MYQSVLKIADFSKTFTLHEQRKLIPSSSNVNLTVASGELTALVGPTGAGKSSVLKSVYRTYLPTSGRILFTTRNDNVIDLVQAHDHQVLELRDTEISFVTQFLHSLPRQTTENIIAMPLLRQGFSKPAALEKARSMLSSLSLPERLWQISPATFSGGERQRVNLARGLIVNPRLLLLDEPTASLDTKTTELVVKQINLLKQRGTAILSIFHDPDLVRLLADKVVELEPPVDTQNFIRSKRNKRSDNE